MSNYWQGSRRWVKSELYFILDEFAGNRSAGGVFAYFTFCLMLACHSWPKIREVLEENNTRNGILRTLISKDVRRNVICSELEMTNC
jgi:hypothetical protein